MYLTSKLVSLADDVITTSQSQASIVKNPVGSARGNRFTGVSTLILGSVITRGHAQSSSITSDCTYVVLFPNQNITNLKFIVSAGLSDTNVIDPAHNVLVIFPTGSDS
jgi:hypothetical protein